MRAKVLPILKFILGWPLSLIALFFIGRTFLPHLSHLSGKLLHLNSFMLILGLLCFFLYYVFRSYIWYKLIVYAGYSIKASESLFLWSFSQLKRYIPGNIWGFLGLTVLYSERKVKKRDIAHAIIIESQLVVIVTLLLSLLAAPFLLAHFFEYGWLQQSVPYLEGTLVVLTGIYVFSPYILKHLPVRGISHIQYFFPQYAYAKTLFLLLLMTISYIFLGFGYYLTITSLVYLDPSIVWQLIGLFVFSLLVGYLSLITPTGLGVREGAITVGLAKIIPLDVAGFAALFARIILVLAELLFVAVSYALFKLGKSARKNMFRFALSRKDILLVFSLVLLFVLYFTAINFLRYDNFYTGRFDLGNMTQTVWNSLHGRIFEFTNPNGTESISRLAFHADFILVLFAPLYALWDSPKMLLLIQVLGVAAGAFFVYGLARDVIKNKAIGVTLAFLYLLNPALERAVMYDFHAVTLATTFLLGAFYFLHKKRYGWFVFFSLLAGLTKEQIWAIIALFGLYIALIQRKVLLGAVVFLLSVLAVYLLIWHAIPSVAGSQHFALSYYDTGDVSNSTPTSLLKRFLFSPQTEIPLLFDKARLAYMRQLLGPLGFLPLLGPLYLIFALPDFAINILSSNANLYQIYYQYTSAITPFLFIAAIFGIAFLLKKFPRLPIPILVAYLLFSGVLSAYLYGPLPGAKEPNLDMITRQRPDREQVEAFLRSIPKNASVAASNSLGSHLSHRKEIFTLPYGVDKADYIVVFRAETTGSLSNKQQDTLLSRLSQDSRYQRVFTSTNVVGYKKI